MAGKQLLTAWGSRDPDTGHMTVHTPEGLWFVLDEKGRKIEAPAPPSKPWPREDYARSLHVLADQAAVVSTCYFIGADEGPIKIGHSRDVPARLRALQMACPVHLRLLATAPGGEQREAAYHFQFHEYRTHGEWFDRCPELLAEIERLSG